MNKLVFSLIITLNMLCFSSFSQGEFIVEIDRTTGNFSKTGPAISEITYISPGIRAYNENNGIFILPAATPQKLFSIDVSNDSVISNPVYANITEFEYSNSLNVLFGLFKDNINDVKYFVSVDPASGLYTIIGNSIPSSATFQGMSTFDNTGNKYIFIDPSNSLYTIDIYNGNVISNPAIALQTGESIISISFDNSTGILYGLLFDYNDQKYYLVFIDTNTGVCTKIGTGTTFASGSGSSAIDNANQQFIYLYGSPGYSILTMDILTGNVIYNNSLPTFDCDNFFSVKYDNIKEKLFSIHWDCFIETDILEPKISGNMINIYPNPFKDKVEIETYGQTVIEIMNIDGHIFETFINSGIKTSEVLSGLSCGLYILKAKSDKGVEIRKLIKQ